MKDADVGNTYTSIKILSEYIRTYSKNKITETICRLGRRQGFKHVDKENYVFNISFVM